MPEKETHCCLGSEENGVTLGRGARADPALQKGEKQEVNAQQRHGQHGEGRGGPTKSDVMKEDWREQSEQSSGLVKFCKHDH